MNNTLRKNIESAIALRVAQALLNAGYSLTLDNGHDDKIAIESLVSFKKHMWKTDEDIIIAKKPDERMNQWVKLLYGEGEDILSDYSVGLEDVIRPLYDENMFFILDVR